MATVVVIIILLPQIYAMAQCSQWCSQDFREGGGGLISQCGIKFKCVKHA